MDEVGGCAGPAALPVVAIGTVFHVGTLDPGTPRRRRGTSLEGDCLSVSLHPLSWRRIARLGGLPCHRLTRPDALFVDVGALGRRPAAMRALRAWSRARGLSTPGRAWRAWRHDDEVEAWGYTTHATRKEAQGEVDGEADEGPRGRAVEGFATELGSPALAAATGMGVEVGDGVDDAILLAWLLATRPTGGGRPIAGLWWREAHDPEALSAPRGGILPGELGLWAAEAVAGWPDEGRDDPVGRCRWRPVAPGAAAAGPR